MKSKMKKVEKEEDVGPVLGLSGKKKKKEVEKSPAAKSKGKVKKAKY